MLSVPARAAAAALQMPTDAGGRAVACRDCCGHWQVYLMLFVMVIPKIDFSLFVVFPPNEPTHTAHTATDLASAAIDYS
jgi:hypothetical protein